uniref:PEST proteolytic signal-containing nuclear protein n=1 Tax=Megaselia scalaris TaxID=36166 RepID=T1GWA3_MEGSC
MSSNISRKREFSSTTSSEESTKSESSSKNHVDDDRNSQKTDLLPPPPAKISKGIIFDQKTKTLTPKGGIQIKLNAVKKTTEKPKVIKVANAFMNDDSDDEVEEMPAECRMRMRNIGRDTPTSSGPNSFGKTKMGFIDSKKIFEKSLREAALE